MKIKTITCHNVYNHGASLQAYSLQEYLSKEGHDVEIIDYNPDRLGGKFNLFAVRNEKYKKNPVVLALYLLAKLPSRISYLKRMLKFNQFSKMYYKLTSKSYTCNDDLINNPPEADIYICGSDQIWNPLYGNGTDPAFFLGFGSENIRRFSYAASLAVDDLTPHISDLYRSNLRNFERIGVRETSALNIVKDLGFSNANHVLDPVFLHPKEFWSEFSNRNYGERYILVQDFDNNEKIRVMAMEYARNNNIKIYALNRIKSKYYDRCFDNSGPIEMVNLIKGADFVISNSFHAVCFSLIFEKEFCVFNRDECINTRMRDLLLILDIFNRLIVDELFMFTDYLNYREINQKLDSMIKQSKEFLVFK